MASVGSAPGLTLAQLVRILAAPFGAALAIRLQPALLGPATGWAITFLAYGLAVARAFRPELVGARTAKGARSAGRWLVVTGDFLFTAAYRLLLPELVHAPAVFVAVAAEAAFLLGSGPALAVGALASGLEGALDWLGAGPHRAFSVERQLFRASLFIVVSYLIAAAVEELRRHATRAEDLSRGALMAVTSAMDARDAYPCDHSRAVADLSAAIARRLGLPAKQVETVYFAALLHDIGKLGVPDRVLTKPGPLTAAERQILRGASQWGANVVARHPGVGSLAEAIRYHTERWDGSGYPEGLKGEAIPLAARIIAAADVYLALTSDRPYRPALAPHEAARTLEAMAGRQLDPQVVEHLLALVASGRPGAAASFDSPGEYGVPPSGTLHPAGTRPEATEGVAAPEAKRTDEEAEAAPPASLGGG